MSKGIIKISDELYRSIFVGFSTGARHSTAITCGNGALLALVHANFAGPRAIYVTADPFDRRD